MGKYYYFAALGTGHAIPTEREEWIKYYSFTGPIGGVHQIILDQLLKAMAAHNKIITRAEIKMVHPNDWACPDLGRMEPHCLDDSIGLSKYQSMMKPAMEAWFLEVEKPDGKPMMICSTGNDGLGVYGCLYELTPGKMEFVKRSGLSEVKEKKSLFNWSVFPKVRWHRVGAFVMA